MSAAIIGILMAILVLGSLIPQERDGEDEE